jgi:transcriptional regulator with XRE-family HTH domain
LRQRREERRLTIDDVAVALRVPPKQLRALEAGEMGVFSANIYARGAYLKYADYLGVPDRRMQVSFLRALSAASAPVPLRLHMPVSWFSSLLTPRFILSAVGALIAALVGGYIALQVGSFFRLPDLAVLEPASDLVASTEVIIQGQAELGADVYVNEEQVILGERGQFETVMFIRPGINVLRVEARNAAGRSRVVERNLLLPRRDI